MLNKQFHVAILSFNHPGITEKCVSSALLRTSTDNITLIHNGSDQKNIEFLTRRFPDIEHHIISENKGYAVGANSGLAHIWSKPTMRSEWVFFLTNDCQWNQTGQVPSHPGLYAPLIYRRKYGKVDSVGGVFSRLSGRLGHLKSEREAKKILMARRLKRFYVPGTAFLVHREFFEKLGGFDESLHTYWEDVDLSLRAIDAKLNLGIVTSFEVTHAVGKTCHGKPFYTQHLYNRNKEEIFKRHGHSGISLLSRFKSKITK